MSLFILSLLNGFAVTKECKPCKESLRDHMPFLIVTSLDQAFSQCPKLVKKVAKKKKINLNLKAVRSNCARLAKKAEKLDFTELDECIKCNDKIYKKILEKEIKNKFLEEGIEVKKSKFEQFTNECSKKSDPHVIEALLKAYNSEVLEEAEKIIRDTKKSQIKKAKKAKSKK